MSIPNIYFENKTIFGNIWIYVKNKEKTTLEKIMNLYSVSLIVKRESNEYFKYTETSGSKMDNDKISRMFVLLSRPTAN